MDRSFRREIARRVIHACLQILVAEQRDELVYHREDIRVSLGIDGKFLPCGNGELRAEHVDGERAVRDGEFHVAERKAAEVDAQRLEKFVPRKDDFEHVLLFGERNIGGKFIGEERREQITERKIARADGGKFSADKLHDERDRLLRIRPDLHAVKIDIRITARIGDADLLLRAADGKRERTLRGEVVQIGNIDVERTADGESVPRVIDRDCKDIAVHDAEHGLRIGNEIGIFALFDGHALIGIGKARGDLRAVERYIRRDMPERDRAVLRDEEFKVNGKRDPHEPERGVERGAPAVVGDCEVSPAELREELIGIERDPAVPAFRKEGTQEREEFFRSRADLYAVAVSEADLPVRIADIEIAELRPKLHIRHVRRVHIDEPRDRRAVDRKIEREGDGAAQHGCEGIGKARRRRDGFPVGCTRSGLIGIIFEVRIVCVGEGFLGIVLVIRRVGRGAADGDAHGRRIRFADDRLQNLPGAVECVRYGDLLEGRQRREPAREHHLVDVVGGRLVGRGIEVIGLGIGAVRIDDDGIGAEQRLLVDDIDGEGRAGQPVALFEILNERVAVRLPVLPNGIHAVVRGGAARGVAPKHAVADIAELPRRIDHARSGDIRLDEHVVAELLVGAHLLLDHRIDEPVHLVVIIILPHEAGVHIADIFERGVRIGRGAVRRQIVRDSDEPFIDNIGCSILKKERVHAENAEAQNCRSGKTCQNLGDPAVIFGFEAQAPSLFCDCAGAFFVFDRVEPLLHTLMRLFHIPPTRRKPRDVTKFYDSILTPLYDNVNKIYDIFSNLCKLEGKITENKKSSHREDLKTRKNTDFVRFVPINLIAPAHERPCERRLAVGSGEKITREIALHGKIERHGTAVQNDGAMREDCRFVHVMRDKDDRFAPLPPER